jgi:hypothetical protein
MKKYKIIAYEVEAEEGGRVDRIFKSDFSKKKDGLDCYKKLKIEEEKLNYYWNLTDKYKEVEILIYLYEDFKVIKRSIVKKKDGGGQK